MPKPSLIVYGNCQAEAVHLYLTKYPPVRDRFDVLYLRSFEHPSEGWQELDARETRRCAVLLEQHDRRDFPDREHLPDAAVTVRFPSMDFNALWPFNRANPYNVPEPPDFPFGRFPYGDHVIVGLIDKGLSAAEVLDAYINHWHDYAPDLDRLYKLEAGRLAARDAHCDIKMGRYITENFRRRRLFWTVNHPTSALMGELIVQLANAALADSQVVTPSDIEAVRGVHFPSDPLGAINVPIHPRVAQHFGLRWYDPGERYPSHGGQSYSYRSYFQTMIETSIRNKESARLV